MRLFASSALLLLLIAFSSPARAEDRPSGTAAFVTGAATLLAGFAVGGTLVAASGKDAASNEAGWLTIETGFILAPLTSHAAVGEWGRGFAFATMPTATTLGSIPVFLASKDAVENGVILQQEAMWWCFMGGLLTSIAGVIDATFAPGRALRVAPVVGPHSARLMVGGDF